MKYRNWEIKITDQGQVTTIDPDPIGVYVTQFFATVEDAKVYIDKRESDKILFKIKYG